MTTRAARRRRACARLVGVAPARRLAPRIPTTSADVSCDLAHSPEEEEAPMRAGQPGAWLRHFGAAAAVVAAWSVAAPAARAEVLLAVANTNVTNLFGGASYLVDFNGTSAAGGTQFTFATSAANTRVAVFFSA